MSHYVVGQVKRIGQSADRVCPFGHVWGDNSLDDQHEQSHGDHFEGDERGHGEGYTGHRLDEPHVKIALKPKTGEEVENLISRFQATPPDLVKKGYGYTHME